MHDLPPVLSDLPDRLTVVTPPSRSFEGFSDAAFDLLDQIKAAPHVETLRRLKPDLDRHVVAPFKRYRDDLVVNAVLPSRLPWETERNVFARFQKNDFGAGGAKSHLWFSFYRIGRKRLYDIQPAHTVAPDSFRFGLFTGIYADDLTKALRTRLAADPDGFARLAAPLFAGGWLLKGEHRAERLDLAPPFDPAVLARLKGLWWTRTVARAEAVALGPRLVDEGLAAMQQLWPMYRQFVGEAEP